MVIDLARETGWSEKFILEELPLARLLIYYHAVLWRRGAWTVPPSDSIESDAEKLGIL